MRSLKETKNIRISAKILQKILKRKKFGVFFKQEQDTGNQNRDEKHNIKENKDESGCNSL